MATEQTGPRPDRKSLRWLNPQPVSRSGASAPAPAYEALLRERLLTQPMIEDIRSNVEIWTAKTNGPLPVSQR